MSNDCFNNLELQGEHLLEKLRLALSNSAQKEGEEKGMQGTTSTTSKCFEHSSFIHQSRPMFPRENDEVAVDATDTPSSSVCPTSPTTSARTLSSDNIQDTSQGAQLLPQPLQPQQQVAKNSMPTASNRSELEPLDFRKSHILHSLLDADLLLDGKGIVSRNEKTDARATKTIEFPSKSQEQTGLQERLRQLGQSQMQQFLLTQQMGKQQALIIQQHLQQKQHQEQQQRQGLPTDGVYRFNDLIPNSYRSSVQAPSSHPLPAHNSINLPSEGNRFNMISHPFKSNALGKNMQSYQASVQTTTSHDYLANNLVNSKGQHPNVISYPVNSNMFDEKKSNKRPRAASSKGSVQGSNGRTRLDLGQSNCSPREPRRATAKRSKKTKDSTFQYIKVIGGGIKGASDQPSIGNVKPVVPPKSKATGELSSLTDYLDSVLESRGYVTSKCSASNLGYVKNPTPLQIASFATAVCSANKPSDADRLKLILKSGLSANPMNKFGDSPFFIACKRGVTEVVKAFIDCGAEVRIADSFGRTPLHHVAWANPPNFDTAKIVLTQCPTLLYVMDNHGKTPLDYVGKCHSSEWIDFIDSMTETLWPANADEKLCHPESSKGPIPNPPNALRIKLAEDVASGMTKPDEVAKMLPSEMSQ